MELMLITSGSGTSGLDLVERLVYVETCLVAGRPGEIPLPLALNNCPIRHIQGAVLRVMARSPYRNYFLFRVALCADVSYFSFPCQVDTSTCSL